MLNDLKVVRAVLRNDDVMMESDVRDMGKDFSDMEAVAAMLESEQHKAIVRELLANNGLNAAECVAAFRVRTGASRVAYYQALEALEAE